MRSKRERRKITIDELARRYRPGTWVVLSPGRAKILGKGMTLTGAMRSAHVRMGTQSFVGHNPYAVQLPTLRFRDVPVRAYGICACIRIRQPTRRKRVRLLGGAS